MTDKTKDPFSRFGTYFIIAFVAIYFTGDHKELVPTLIGAMAGGFIGLGIHKLRKKNFFAGRVLNSLKGHH